MNIFKVPQEHYSFLRNLVLLNKSKDKLTSMAIGRAIGHHTTLPGQEVGSPVSFFSETGGVAALNFLDKILDVIPFDHKASFEFSKKFYLVRYETVYGRCVTNTVSNSLIYDLSGFSFYFSEPELSLLEASSVEFQNLVSGFESIFKAFTESEKN